MNHTITGTTASLASAFEAAFINECGVVPNISLTLGSGLAHAVEHSEFFTIKGEINVETPLAFKHFPVFTAQDHKMRVLIAEENVTKKLIVVMCGRKHVYEIKNDEEASEVLRVPRALALAGVRNFVNTSAVGGIDPVTPGSIVVITDHDGGELLPASLFTGTRSVKYGPLFFDCTRLYKKINLHLDEYKTAYKFPICEGKAQWYRGPYFETPTQIQRLKSGGMSIVGMSGLPETMALNHMRQHVSGEFKDIQIIGIGMVSNPGAGLGRGDIDSEDVNAVMQKNASQLMEFIAEIIRVENL